jgi:hypothetical protein
VRRLPANTTFLGSSGSPHVNYVTLTTPEKTLLKGSYPTAENCTFAKFVNKGKEKRKERSYTIMPRLSRFIRLLGAYDARSASR